MIPSVLAEERIGEQVEEEEEVEEEVEEVGVMVWAD